jgi:hypothetical protein
MPVIINGSTGISGTDGTAATPAVQGTDTNTGMFFPAADTIAFSEGGTEVMRINPTGVVNFASPPTVAGVSVLAGPAFRAYLSNNQVINGSTYTKVLLNAEDFDTNNAFNTSNSRFQPSVAGYYQISATAELASNSDIGVIGVFKNGTEVNRFAHLASNASVTWATFTFTGSAVIYMNGSSDYLELYAFIRALSGTPTVINGSPYTTMSGFLARAA